MRRTIALAVCLATLNAVTSGAAFAQDFPHKPPRMVVPFPPGGGTDVVGRVFAQQLSVSMKQTVVVDNRPGANTIIGSDNVAKSAADGYTWLVASPSHTINPSLYAKKLPYDTEKDFVPVSMLAEGPLVLVVNPSVPIRSVRDLIDYARKNPGKLRYGSAGTGSSPHLAGVMFSQLAGVNIEHVPYKGTAPSITDLLGGHIELTFTPVPGVLQQIETGKLRAIAVTTAQRFRGLPDLPTIRESGLPGYEISQWWGLLVPRGTPHAVIEKIDASVREAQKRPDVQKTLLEVGAEVSSPTAAQFQQQIDKEISTYGKLVDTAKITPES